MVCIHNAPVQTSLITHARTPASLDVRPPARRRGADRLGWIVSCPSPAHAYMDQLKVSWLTGHWHCSTNCLQTGSECIYPSPEQALPSSASSAGTSIASASGSNTPSLELQLQRQPIAAPLAGVPNPILNDYVGGSFEDLPEASKRLLKHCMPSLCCTVAG